MTESLLEDLRRAAQPAVPKDFRPGITYVGRDPLDAVINTEAIPAVETEEEWEAAVKAMGIHLPEGYGLVLVHAELAGSTNEAAWHRDAADRGGKDTAYTAPNTVQRWRYRFKVVLKDPRADADIAALMQEAKRVKRPRPLMVKAGGSFIVNLADFQVGKVDARGGTEALLERSEVALAQVIERVKTLRPAEIVLVDVGDSTEGFESSPNAERTNDLQVTEQIRIWRRIFWRWVDALSRLTERLVVAGVPSNHCRVRRGKAYLGTTLDDWGIEVIAQVADIAAVNPEAYGHVVFQVPQENEEHLLLTLVDGKTVGFVHGHQVANADRLADYVKRNSRRGIGRADVVFVGHFHHLRVTAFGDEQYLFVCPTNDGGSTWFAGSGEFSAPGVLSLVVDADGWRDLHVAWT